MAKLGFRITLKVVDGGWRSVLFVQGLPQPLLQDGQKNWLHVAESQTHPQGRLGVNNRGGRLEEMTTGMNSYVYPGAARQGSFGVQIAAVKTEFVHLCRFGPAGIQTRDFSGSGEWKPGGAAL